MMRFSQSWRLCAGAFLVLAVCPFTRAQETFKPGGRAAEALSTPASKPQQQGKRFEYHVEGQYVECCSCRAPCACELTGDVMMDCHGVGAIEISKGSYKGVDLSGAKIAYALGVGKWVDLYVDAKRPEQSEAAKALARAAYAGFGPVQDVKDAKIELKRDGYAYSVSVDGGKTMEFSTEPVLGGDKRTPLAHENVSNAFNRTFYQGKSVTCTYHGPGEKSFTVEKGRNAYFNGSMRMDGEL